MKSQNLYILFHFRATTLGASVQNTSIEKSSKIIGDPIDEKKHKVKLDMFAILQQLLLQDVPFFCLRMTLIFQFQVISHMNIFFTCKNTLIILLQLYRLLVLVLERRPVYRRQSRIFSIVANTYDSTNLPEIRETDENTTKSEEPISKTAKKSSPPQNGPRKMSNARKNYKNSDSIRKSSNHSRIHKANSSKPR